MIRPFDITKPPLPNGTLIEASAGTGKTHAVAAYVTKAIATTEDLRIGEILVTTYTRNAAAELRERIRSRLVVSAQLLRGRAAPPGYRRDQLDELLEQASEKPAIARRLERAAAEFDTATIGTIHAICARVLRLAGIPATETGDEELRDRVLDEVINDAMVTEAIADRHWEVKPLRALVAHSMADPFLETTYDPDEVTPDQIELLARVPDLVRRCALRARERMRASPSFDDLLVRAWEEVTPRESESPADEKRKQAFLGMLRERFKLAIVDEAQDTNRLQWEFFHAIFPTTGKSTLIAVGDPKQAIYRFRGADVTAYITHAQDGVPHEEGLPPAPSGPPRRTLSVNWRSDGPLLGGLNAVMEGAKFGKEIPYREVAPAAGREASQVVGLGPVEFLDVGDTPLVEAAVRKVRELLTVPHFKPSEKRPFRPGEVCVLVRSNRNGLAIARRLLDLKIPAVTEGTASVFNGQMAADIRCLLEAMERPSDSGRARRAAATAFFGARLADVASLGVKREQQVQAAIATLHTILQRKGIAAMAAEIMSDEKMVTRFATGEDGDRRIVDFAHVIELLNDSSRGQGCHAREMLEHFTALAAQDEKTDLVSRRVESDAEAVTIMTVHAAKGLQFPAVLVVDAWIARPSTTQLVVFHRDGTRWVDIGKVVANGKAGDEAKLASRQAEEEELRRLIYVAVTRPEHHVCILRTTDWNDSVLGDVLVNAPSDAGKIVAKQASMIAIRSADELPEPMEWVTQPNTKMMGVAAVPTSVEQTYRRTSYSDISRRASRAATNVHDDDAPGNDEELPDSTDAGASWEGDESPESAGDMTLAAGEPDVSRFTIASLPAGKTFGIIAHEIFEKVEAGRDVPEAALRESVHRVVGEAATARFLQPHRDAFAAMIADAMLTPFGGPAGASFRGLRFADFAAQDRLVEMDFEMALAAFGKGVQARHVGQILKQFIGSTHPLYAYAQRLAGPAFDVPLAGLITGSIDAVLRLPDSSATDPRILIADYKTNRLHARDALNPLADYAPERLVAAMADHHYPLQALVYGTAIWRMLRWKLERRKPAGWDPGECIAGVVYAYVRGMKGPDTPVDAAGGRYGVFTWQPPPAIWRRLSDLFAGNLTGVKV